MDDPLKQKLEEMHADVREIKTEVKDARVQSERERKDRFDILIHIWTGITALERKFVALFHREDKKNGPRN